MHNSQSKHSNEFVKIFSRGWLILTASNLRADMLREKANKVKIGKNWIEDLNKRDRLIHEAEIIEWRGRKVWAELNSYRGKYINFCSLTSDNILISDVREKVQRTYEDILPIAKKLAGVKQFLK